MPDDHPRPIENLLREWARKRRDAAGDGVALELHRRAQLQEEVSRVYAAPAVSAPATPWWRMLWPRLALAGALGVVFIVTLTQLGPRSDESKGFDLAKAKTSEAAPAPSPSVEAFLARPDSGGEKAEEEQTTGPSSPPLGRALMAPTAGTTDWASATPPPPAAEPVVSRPAAAAAPPVGSAPTVARRTGVSTAASPPALAGAASSPAPYANTQQFSQVQRRRPNLNSPPLPPVLQSFRVEQVGQRLRIVDADGSVYEGQFEVPPLPAVAAAEAQPPEASARQEVPTVVTFGTPPDNRETKVQAATPRRAAPASNTQALAYENSFRVTGTNRTSGMSVVFDGVLTGDSSQASQMAFIVNQAAGASNAPRADMLQNQAQFPASRLRGQLQLGRNQRMQIEAVPVSP